ncbi:MAG: UvrD-helicase domain-containing protein [Bacteroidales bacterium]|nr:UvrD-helicase domain-containing protein [Bacteroidales bacterium]
MLNIYKASAGSGKTFTLTYEYLRLLLGITDPETLRRRLNTHPSQPHRSILAITFTNKATEEMKRRILHELAVLAKAEPGWTSPSPYQERLMKELECTSEALQEASLSALRSLLYDFNFFHISTIDSFFQKVLKTFAREAELTGDFNVVLDDKEILQEATHQLFTSFNNRHLDKPGKLALQWITDYLVEQADNGRSYSLFNRSSNTFNTFIKAIDALNNEQLAVHRKEITEYLSDPERIIAFNEQLRAKLNINIKIKEAAKRALDLANVYDPAPTLSKNPKTLLKKLAETGLSKWNPAAKTFESILNDPNNAFKKESLKKIQVPLDLSNAILYAIEIASSNYKEWSIAYNIKRQIFQLGIVGRIYEEANVLCQDRNFLMLSSTNSILQRIIGDDDAPFIYERMGNWYRHFLIDEFQDTSVLQWANLRPLVNESLATEQDNLIIGDEKQCIYRFRNSDYSLLQHQVEEQYQGRVKVHGQEPSSNTNWRSSATVVDFNNRLFEAIISAQDLTDASDIYANVKQQVSPKGQRKPGIVKIRACNIAAKDDDGSSLDGMVEDIRRQLESGYRPCDIAILTSTKADGQTCMNYLLQARANDPTFPPFNIVSEEMMVLESSPAVKLILSVLRSMAFPVSEPEDPEDSTPDEAPTHRRRQRKSRRQTMEMLNRYEYLLNQGEQPQEALRRAIDSSCQVFTTDDVAKGGVLGLSSLIEHIIHLFISKEQRQSNCAFLSAFMDVIVDYTSRGPNDLYSFLTWWDVNKDNLKVSSPNDEQAISIMTIHKSKGLEFPCVHLPIIKGGPTDNLYKTLKWFKMAPLDGIDPAITPPFLPLKLEKWMVDTPFEKQYLEEQDATIIDGLNKLYVGFTRAINELSIQIYTANKKESYPTMISEAVKQAFGHDLGPDSPLELGAPTRPMKEEKKPRTALEPSCSEGIDSYQPMIRSDIWDGTTITDVDGYNLSRPQDRGLMLHEVMSHIATIVDVDRAFKIVERTWHNSEADTSALKAWLKAQLTRPDVARWFAPDVKRLLRERPLTNFDGRPLRPDRVVWTADGYVDVIDYKFGPIDMVRYPLQVREYMRALTDMGCRNVRGYIWSFKDDSIMQVTL